MTPAAAASRLDSEPENNFEDYDEIETEASSVNNGLNSSSKKKGANSSSGTNGRRKRRERRRRRKEGEETGDEEGLDEEIVENEMEYCDPCYCYGKCCLDVVASIFCVSLL